MQYELVKNNRKAAQAAINELRKWGTLGWDSETTSLDPHGGRVRLVQLATPEKVFMFDAFDISPDTVYGIKEILEDRRRIKCAHNAKFDAQFVFDGLLDIEIDPDGIYDTMLASQVVSAGNPYDQHSLKEVTYRYLGKRIEKTMQLADWTGELTPAHLEYGAQDAHILLPLQDELNRNIRRDGLMTCAMTEFDACVPLARVEYNGLYLDRDGWIKQLGLMMEKRKAVAEELQAVFGFENDQQSLFGMQERIDINLDSHTQVKRAFTRLGIPVPESTRNHHLKPLGEKYPVVAKLLEYRAIQKKITSYGYNIVDSINPVTGRIHASFRQIGAPTGRMACSDPNVQQVPHEPEYRGCIQAEEGKVLVIADFSQVELRLLAEFTGDEAFIAAFHSGTDFHRATAAQVFNLKPEDVTKEQRDFAKRLNFGVVYGIGAQRFAGMTGLSEAEAEGIINKYFATYRKVDAWLRAQAAHALRHKFTHTASGRLCRFFFDENDKGEAGLAQRNGKNSPIQGSSADVTKRGLYLLDKALAHTSAMITNVVHDEYVIEVSETEAEEVAQITINCMESAGSEIIKRVPCLADYKISKVWIKE